MAEAMTKWRTSGSGDALVDGVFSTYGVDHLDYSRKKIVVRLSGQRSG
jgi:hypothetical protein